MTSLWLLLLGLLVQFVNSEEEYEPSWSFKCVPDEGCQRTIEPLKEGLGVYRSISVCRTVCGRYGGLWPKPMTAELSKQTVMMHPRRLSFKLANTNIKVRPLLVKMTRTLLGDLLSECRGNVTELTDTPVVVQISVKSPNLQLTWDTDEQYMLDVQTKDGQVEVHISAETVYGARHGLESFSQLIAPDILDSADIHKCSLRIVSGAKVFDRPAYKHRGLLLDTSRHYFPVEDIKRTIKGMSTVKMNVFHWHVIDSHSFPLESGRIPQFTRYGAYSAYEIYTAQEVEEIINFAQSHGVRVVIEIDAPAHAGNGWQWGKDYGYGDLAVCVNQQPWSKFCIQPPCGQLNPANRHMYEVLKNLYRDITAVVLTPPLLHMGGDEVSFDCWNSSAEIINFMKKLKFDVDSNKGFFDLWGKFHTTALRLWDEALSERGVKEKLPVIVWSSDLTQSDKVGRYLDPERFVIEVWEPINSYQHLSLPELGYRTIHVPLDVWYLKHGSHSFTSKYSNWKRMYTYKLPESNNVLGGEVAMWSELIDDNGLDSQVWPRAAAVAERLWSNPATAADAAQPRLQRHRERLLSRGLRPGVLTPGWCAQNDAKCLLPIPNRSYEKLDE